MNGDGLVDDLDGKQVNLGTKKYNAALDFNADGMVDKDVDLGLLEAAKAVDAQR